MKTIVAHIPDLTAFRAECKALAEQGNPFFDVDEDTGAVVYKIDKVPVVYSAEGTQSVCLVRLSSPEEIQQFNALDSVQRIGEHRAGRSTYDFDEGGEAIYDSIYDRTPVTLISPDGVEIEITPPQLIGVFA